MPVPPVKKDLCVFVDSDLKGTKGTIMGFDDDEAIVSDDLDNWHMGSVKHLCKLKAWIALAIIVRILYFYFDF